MARRLIQVEAVEVTNEDATLRVTVRYIVRRTQTARSRRVHPRRIDAMIYLCCDNRRRCSCARRTIGALPTARPRSTESTSSKSSTSDAPPGVGIPRQRTLLVRLFKPVPALDRDNVRIDGGERITPVRVVWASPGERDSGCGRARRQSATFSRACLRLITCMVVRTDSTGDYSHLPAVAGRVADERGTNR